MKRVITALWLIPLVTYMVLWADFRVFFTVLAIAAFLSYREYNEIAAAYGFGAPGAVGYGAGLLLLGWNDAWAPVWLLAVIIAGMALLLAMRTADLAKSLPGAALSRATCETMNRPGSSGAYSSSSG